MNFYLILIALVCFARLSGSGPAQCVTEDICAVATDNGLKNIGGCAGKGDSTTAMSSTSAKFNVVGVAAVVAVALATC